MGKIAYAYSIASAFLQLLKITYNFSFTALQNWVVEEIPP